MNLNAKDETRDLLARKGEAAPLEAMRSKPVALTHGDATGLVLSRKIDADDSDPGAPRASSDLGTGATTKPPSSLLDYHLVRVSSYLEDPEPLDDVATVPTGQKPTALSSDGDQLVQDTAADGSSMSRRLGRAAAISLAISLALVILIGAVLAL